MPPTVTFLATLAKALSAAGRSAEALPVTDDCVRRAARQPVDTAIVPAALALRRRHFQKANDPAGCRATAALWEGQNPTDPAGLLSAARYRAVAAGLYAQADRPAEAAADADRAMAWLTKAFAAGSTPAPTWRRTPTSTPFAAGPTFGRSWPRCRSLPRHHGRRSDGPTPSSRWRRSGPLADRAISRPRRSRFRTQPESLGLAPR